MKDLMTTTPALGAPLCAAPFAAPFAAAAPTATSRLRVAGTWAATHRSDDDAQGSAPRGAPV